MTTADSTLLQRVILPRSGDPMSVRALYMDERTGLALATVPAAPGAIVHNPVHLEGAAVTGRRLRVTSRTSACLPDQSEVSFGAYFNGFAAGYWRHWTPLTEVRLKLRLEGSGRVDIYRSKSEGARIHERGVVLGTRGVHEVDVVLDLRPFEDGGWYWFDLTTDDDALTLHEGGWHAPVEAPGTAAVTIGMPTFNRPADCVATLTAIGEDPLVLAAVHQVILPDQGTRKVRDEPGFAAAEAGLGGRLRIIDQPNLGGSGGYARVMYEALATPETQQILFMDDDILLEPDSVLRAVAFSRFAREPMLVGGQMLSLQVRSQLSTMGEVVDRNKFLWRNAPARRSRTTTSPSGPPPADRVAAPAGGRRLQRLVDVPDPAGRRPIDYRAAAAAVHQVGRRRVRRCGPGRAATGRRRCRASRSGTCRSSRRTTPATGRPTSTTATGSWRPRCTGRTTRRPCSPTSSSGTVRHLMLMEYSAVALQHMALRDFLAGPETLFPSLPVVLGQVRATRAEYDDGRPLDSATQVPPSSLDALAAQAFPVPPTTKPAILTTLARSLVRNLRTPARRITRCRSATCRHGRPSGSCCPRSTRRRSRRRTAAVSPSGAGTPSCSGPRKTSAQLLGTAAKEWPALRRRYRGAAPHLTSREGWKQIFED